MGILNYENLVEMYPILCETIILTAICNARKAIHVFLYDINSDVYYQLKLCVCNDIGMWRVICAKLLIDVSIYSKDRDACLSFTSLL